MISEENVNLIAEENANLISEENANLISEENANLIAEENANLIVRRHPCRKKTFTGCSEESVPCCATCQTFTNCIVRLRQPRFTEEILRRSETFVTWLFTKPLSIRSVIRSAKLSYPLIIYPLKFLYDDTINIIFIYFFHQYHHHHQYQRRPRSCQYSSIFGGIRFANDNKRTKGGLWIGTPNNLKSFMEISFLDSMQFAKVGLADITRTMGEDVFLQHPE